jgi:hypothetical protein
MGKTLHLVQDSNEKVLRNRFLCAVYGESREEFVVRGRGID